MSHRQPAVTRRSFLGATVGTLGAVGLESRSESLRQVRTVAAAQPLTVDLAVATIVPATPAANLSRLLERARQGGLGVAVTTVVENEDWPAAVERVDSFTPLLNKFGLAHCRTVAEIEAAHRAGQTAAVYRSSGAYWFAGPHGGHPMISVFEPARIATMHRLGVRVMQLTDDYKGWLGDGCTERTDCGLTDYGLWAIRTMNELGIVIDCSHAGYRTSMEAIEQSRAPVIFSHSNVSALCPSKRNLRDDQIRAAAAKGGVIGVNALAAFVDLKDPSLSRLLDHANYIARLVGVEHVALGLGYAQETGTYGLPRRDPATYPKPPWQYALKDYAELPALREGLRAKGFGDAGVGQILGGNALRLFREVWKG